MLCSLCLKQKSQTIQLPCSHIICPECIPKLSFMNNMFRYQCQTCFAYHEIPLNQDNMMINKQRSDGFREYELRSSSHSNGDDNNFFGECVYCSSCDEAVGIKEYIKGRHHNHEVSTFGQALPRIKNTLAQQVLLTKHIKTHFEQVKQRMQNDELEISYNQLKDRVNIYFNKQFQILESKRIQIIDILAHYYDSICDETKQSINKLSPVIYDLQSLKSKMEGFLNDKVPITEINPIKALLQKVQSFREMTKDKNIFKVESMPQFVTNYSIEKYVDQSCQLQRLQIGQNNQKNHHLYERNNQSIHKPYKSIQIRSEFMNQSRKKVQQKQIKLQRRVKLLEKLKDKMKYTTSMCSTGFL